MLWDWSKNRMTNRNRKTKIKYESLKKVWRIFPILLNLATIEPSFRYIKNGYIFVQKSFYTRYISSSKYKLVIIEFLLYKLIERQSSFG